MICEHSGCTGKHRGTVDVLCPAALERMRARHRGDSRKYRERKRNDPEWVAKERQRSRTKQARYRLTAAGMVSAMRSDAKRRGSR